MIEFLTAATCFFAGLVTMLALTIHNIEKISIILPRPATVKTYLEWAHKTFQHVDPSVNVLKLVEEVTELAEDPTNGEEMADVLMVLIYQASLAGVDLAAEFNKKLQTNLQRTWHQNADGTYSHDG